MKPAYKIVKDARDLIKDERNWIKGKYEGQNSYCMLGAIRKAAAGDPYIQPSGPHFDVYFRALDTIRKVVDGSDLYPLTDIAKFNDDKSTTHKDVIRVMNKALRKLR